MDPNATLDMIRKCIETARELMDQIQNDAALVELEIAAETFEDLDEWLSKGGFLPTKWEASRRTYEAGD